MTRRPPTYAPPWHAILTALLFELWRCIRPRPECEPDPEELSILFGFEQGPLETTYQLFHLPPEAGQAAVDVRFKEFAESYLVLSNPEKRAAYDLDLAKEAYKHTALLTRGHLDRSGPAYQSVSPQPRKQEAIPEGADGVPRGFQHPAWETHYQVFRLHPRTSQDEIEARFRQMLEAYVTLSDPAKRQAYNLELQMKAFRHEVARLKRSDPERFGLAEGSPHEA